MAGRLSRGVVLAIYAAIIAIPLFVVFFGSFKTTAEIFENSFAPPTSLNLSNYSEVLTGGNLGVAFLNSAIITVSSVTITLFIGSLAAYGVSRIPGWKGWLIFGFIVLGMSVPAQANMIPQFVQFNQLGLLNSQLGLILINIVVTLPVSVFIMGGFMRTLPHELYEAADIDGSGPWRTYWSIAMPLSAPSIAATATFLFVMHWNELLYPLLFISTEDKLTLPLALLRFQGEYLTNYPLLFAGVVLSSIPIVIAYVFLQRYFVAGMTSGAVKG
ncbi:carbohydrate ABC transporter permease [Microbacterium sp. No. 7]|uniref:carbohydrate ABC transporter permease n=1 Tax=Microbacterium sp. No. 7 TaxID=1714373 RepID=UPI0006CFE8EB|nr:carbohydrate ABC transporter permease [Microbacterium sp. No. 7]ALJ21983.1 ABC transporter permease [Microbacterium sp. No. 7]